LNFRQSESSRTWNLPGQEEAVLYDVYITPTGLEQFASHGFGSAEQQANETAKWLVTKFIQFSLGRPQAAK
jgi:hypothetical protein